MAPIGASRGSIFLLAGLAFLAGGAVGAVIDHKVAFPARPDLAWSRIGQSWAEDQAERWTRALDLTADQRAAVVASVADLKPRYQQIYLAVRDSRRAVDRDFQDRLRRILGEEQRARLDRLLADDAARRRKYYEVPAEQPEFGCDECTEKSAAQ